jgi:hypothetical protein
MEGLKQLLTDYIRQSWPPFAAGTVLGFIIGAWLL